MRSSGVVRNARQSLADQARPEIDFPFSNMTLEQQKNTGSLSVCLFIRTAVPPATIIGQLGEAVHEVAPAVAFQTPATMNDLLDDALVTNRMESWLFGIFAGISVVLAAVGVQGLLTQEVTSRTRDIGVRIAVGASRATIARMMLTRISFLLAIGLGAGMGIVFLLHRVVASVVAVQFERDGVVIAALAFLLGAIGLAAAIPPTRRAASIDPVQTLRMELTILPLLLSSKDLARQAPSPPTSCLPVIRSKKLFCVLRFGDKVSCRIDHPDLYCDVANS